MRLSEIKPHFYLVIGGAGSGKNHFISTHAQTRKCKLIDVDVMKLHMPLNDAIKAIGPSLRAAFEAGIDVAHPTTGTNLVAQKRKIAMAHEYGYTVVLILIDTPVDRAIAQVRDRYRNGGHDVALDKIVSSNRVARENFNALAALADETLVQ